jgi:DNA mismatch repair protein MutH
MPSRFGSHRIDSDGVRLESSVVSAIDVVTPSTLETSLAMESSHDIHRLHSALWSRFIHISTAISIPIASSLPTFIERLKP